MEVRAKAPSEICRVLWREAWRNRGAYWKSQSARWISTVFWGKASLSLCWVQDFNEVTSSSNLEKCSRYKICASIFFKLPQGHTSKAGDVNWQSDWEVSSRETVNAVQTETNTPQEDSVRSRTEHRPARLPKCLVFLNARSLIAYVYWGLRSSCTSVPSLRIPWDDTKNLRQSRTDAEST